MKNIEAPMVFPEKEWTTYCEIGGVNLGNGARVVHRSITGAEGYDHFALALYFKQILEFQRLKNMSRVTLSDLPRKEKILFLYELFKRFDFKLSYFEIGSCLFEVIDGLELMTVLCQEPADLKSHILYQGIEISDLFRQAASFLHPQYRLRFLNGFEELDQVDLIYDRIVSSYCFKNSRQLAAALNKSRLAYVNLFLSKTLTYDLMNDTGKVSTYFGIAPLLNYLKKPLFYLFGRHNERSVEGFFLNCEPEDLDTLLVQFRSNRFLGPFMQEKGIFAVNINHFVEENEGRCQELRDWHCRESFDDRFEEYRNSLTYLRELR